ncbi:MAG: diguanylate cyclase [Candidatus Omnitrophota bacterium]
MRKKTLVCVGLKQDFLHSLESFFDTNAFNFSTVSTAKELMDDASKHSVGLIFLNSKLPDLNDIQELCIALRALTNTETVPIIILNFESSDPKEKIKLFNAALVDGYFTAPISFDELAAYSNVFLQHQALEQELEAKNNLLAKISMTDELMQIYNRRYLIKRIDEEIARIKRYHYPLSMIMVDIDYFKNINDRYGHSQGDIVLKKLANLIKDGIRNIDILCRYGGDEIVIISPHTNLENAQVLAERLKNKVKSYNFEEINPPLEVALSLGVVSFPDNAELSFDIIVQALDKQLYKAKHGGRDKICAAEFQDIDLAG